MFGLAAVFLMTLSGCSSGYQGASSTIEVPTEAGFASVVAPLDYSCGSLDCHGQAGRNLRLYGRQGRRLDPSDVPCGAETTDAEISADYESVIGLEPELMAAVRRDGGRNPERLTLIRKARGTEKHTGGVVFARGSDGDQCLVNWLSGDVADATAACNNVFAALNPTPLCAR
jgi:hypothetical protein